MKFLKTYWPMLCTLIFWALLIFLCASCTTTKYYPLENSLVVRDSVVYRDSVIFSDSVLIRDSLIIRDSVVVTLDSSGNIINKEKYQSKEVYNFKDSASKQVQDKSMNKSNQSSENTKTEVVKESWFDKVKSNIAYVIGGAVALVLLFLYLKLSKNKN